MNYGKAPAPGGWRRPAIPVALVVVFLLLAPIGEVLAQGNAAGAPGASEAPAAAEGPLSVSSSELQSASASGVTFVDYQGPQSRVETAAEITAIGTGLGMTMGASRDSRTPLIPRRFGDFARYAVIRAVDPSVKDGFEADILVLGADSQVDQIRNLRRIIAGYLSSAWGYSGNDAATLAIYVTIYNAVHRGDMAYFTAKYKAVVPKELSASTAGLALRYDEWPGRSRIVIPLSRGARPGALGAVNTGVVSEKGVTENLRSQPGAGLGERQAMTELKDREAQQKAADLAAQQAQIAKDEAALAAQKAKMVEDQAALDKQRAAAAAASQQGRPAGAAQSGGAQPAASATPTAPASSAAGAAGSEGAEGAGQQASIADKEAALKAEQAQAAQAEADLAAKKAAAAQTAQEVESKKAEVASDRASIANDQKAAIAANVAAKAAGEVNGIYLLQLEDASGPFSRIVYVDAATGRLIRASTLNTLRVRTVAETGDSFVAVAGKEGGNGAVRLVSVAKADLQETAEGTTDLFADTGLWSAAGAWYAIIKAADGAFHLGRFDAGLAETARSTTAVNPWTALAPGKDGLIVQASPGGFVVLSVDTLEVVRELKP